MLRFDCQDCMAGCQRMEGLAHLDTRVRFVRDELGVTCCSAESWLCLSLCIDRE